MVDVDAINAALRLGDWCVPPRGTVVYCEFFGGKKSEPYEVLRARPGWVSRGEGTDHFRVAPICPSDDWIEGDAVWVMSGNLFQVMRVPLDAPPFEEWPRPPSEKSGDRGPGLWFSRIADGALDE